MHLLEASCGELLLSDLDTRIEDVVAQRVRVKLAQIEEPAFKDKPPPFRTSCRLTRGGFIPAPVSLLELITGRFAASVPPQLTSETPATSVKPTKIFFVLTGPIPTNALRIFYAVLRDLLLDDRLGDPRAKKYFLDVFYCHSTGLITVYTRLRATGVRLERTSSSVNLREARALRNATRPRDIQLGEQVGPISRKHQLTFLCDGSIHNPNVKPADGTIFADASEVTRRYASTEGIVAVVKCHLLKPCFRKLFFGDLSTRIEHVITNGVRVELAKLEEPAFKLKPTRLGTS